MAEYKSFKCPNCGGIINPSKKVCEYCGTPFKIKEDNIVFDVKVENFNRECERLFLEYDLPLSAYTYIMTMPPHERIKIVQEQMVNEIAKAISDRVKIVEMFDPLGDAMKFRAELYVGV